MAADLGADAETARARRHLVECPACGRAWAEARRLVEALKVDAADLALSASPAAAWRVAGAIHGATGPGSVEWPERVRKLVPIAGAGLAVPASLLTLLRIACHLGLTGPANPTWFLLAVIAGGAVLAVPLLIIPGRFSLKEE
jgi:anti-sigma factor RsiW